MRGDIKKTAADKKNELNYVNKSDVIQGISKEIKEEISTADYDRLKSINADEKHNIHHAAASNKAKNGAYVFEIRTAGSGNNQWNKTYKNFNGHDKIMTYTPEEMAELEEEKNYYDEIANRLKVNYKVDINKNITDKQLNDAITDEYGKTMYWDSKEKKLKPSAGKNTRELKGVRIKVTDDYKKVTANLSGPLGSIFGKKAGIRNSGDYRIEKLKTYMLQLADDWLSEVEKHKKETGDKEPVFLYMQGHSRGGVATAEASSMIQRLIDTKYRDLKNRIHINVRVYDPVPGTGSFNNHSSIDHGSEDISLYKGRMGTGIMSGDNKTRNDFTVFYSLHSNHTSFFDPMTVLGAKRVIFTPKNHDVGIYDVADDEGKRHKKGYISAENGEEYRGTGVHELKEGMYIADENNVLTEIKNQQEAYTFLKKVFSRPETKGQAQRHNTMLRTAQDWFTQHDDVITEKDTRYFPKQALQQDIEALKNYLMLMSDPDPDNRPADPVGMKNKIVSSLMYHTGLMLDVNSEKYRFRRTTFDAYKEKALNSKYVYDLAKSDNYRKYFADLTEDRLRAIAEGDTTALLTAEYNKLQSTVYIEKTVDSPFADLTEKSINGAQHALADVLKREASDDPSRKLADSAEARRFIVADIISKAEIRQKMKGDFRSMPEASAKTYEEYIAESDSNINRIADSAQFKSFYSTLKKADLLKLAYCSPDILLNEYVSRYTKEAENIKEADNIKDKQSEKEIIC